MSYLPFVQGFESVQSLGRPIRTGLCAQRVDDPMHFAALSLIYLPE